MPDSLAGRSVFVTGASEGIGLAIASALAKQGAHVGMCARRAETLSAAAQQIAGAGGSVETITLDVVELDALTAALRRFAEARGRLDGLVNNAYIFSPGTIVDLSLQDWRRHFAINVDAPFATTREALRLMIAQGSGSIVNVASINAIRALAGSAAYSASKAALVQLGAVAAMEAAPSRVRVNTVIPGLVATPGTSRWSSGDPKFYDKASASIPMRRPGDPAEIAGAVLFLLSDAATYMTGQTIVVDGGKTSMLYVDL
jgi:NAD(P)-dependent dehydrogenase (short-subunit alcohol dehydrogenase family)